MNQELENKLFRDHWILSNSLAELEGQKVSFSLFGIECDDGWYKLIDELCTRIESKLDKETDDFLVLQIKEKFAGLRFYVGGTTDEILDLIDEYEEKSYTICEGCGNPGKTVCHYGWYSTLCEKCEKEWVSKK